jgi:hypothetical protein
MPAMHQVVRFLLSPPHVMSCPGHSACVFFFRETKMRWTAAQYSHLDVFLNVVLADRNMPATLLQVHEDIAISPLVLLFCLWEQQKRRWAAAPEVGSVETIYTMHAVFTQATAGAARVHSKSVPT